MISFLINGDFVVAQNPGRKVILSADYQKHFEKLESSVLSRLQSVELFILLIIINPMHSALIIGSYAILTIASGYLLVRNRFQYIIYSIVLVLTFGAILGSLFSILHLKGADQLLLTGFAGTILGAFLLIWKSIRNIQHQVLLYKLISGLILLFQIVSFLLWPQYAERTGLLNYPLTAFIATVLINGQYEHEGERNILILFMLLGFLYILVEVLKMF